MIYDKAIAGKCVQLRCVEEVDSQFILDIRTNPQNSRYINKTDYDISKQIEWIKSQQKRENDYYFIIQTLDGQKVGTISLYNIDFEKREAEFGRWICAESPIYSLESVLLIYKFAFDVLNMQLVYTRTMKDNQKVVRFHEQFGAKTIGEMHLNGDKTIFIEQQINKGIYAKKSPIFSSMINQYNGGIEQ